MELLLPDRPALSASLGYIPNGAAGTRATLARMLHLIYDARTDPAVRDAAVAITADLPQKDFRSELEALFAFVRDRIRYVRDIHDLETLSPPGWLLQVRAGDCDDKSILLCALAQALGFPYRLVAGGWQPGHYVHVWCEARLGSTWIPLDATEPRPAGWAPPLPYLLRAQFAVS